MQKENRRSFLKKSLAILGAAPVAFGVAQSAFAQTDPTTPVDPASPLAMALGYHHDTTKVDAAKYPMHAASKRCDGCQLYLKGGLKAAGQAGDWGVCGVFPGALVRADGWCQSWVAKA